MDKTSLLTGFEWDRSGNSIVVGGDDNPQINKMLITHKMTRTMVP